MELVWKTGEQEEDEKKVPNVATLEIDEESGEYIPEKRGLHLQNTILVAITIALIMTTLGAGFREVAIETDHFSS
ncbi:glycosyltransferase family 2 protein [Rutstroemia sp. NJR-2017a BBW]|nr:glycosyltransferase family 2 protein [Rutstroemia sp. NJR-2017a BBW]